MNQTLNYKFCSYHPNKLAIAICEKCHKYICQKDLKVISKLESNSFYGNSLSSLGVSSFGINKIKYFCLVCYSQELKRDINPIKIILIFLPFFIFFFVLLSKFQPYFFISVFFLLIFIFIYVWQVYKYLKIQLKVISLKYNLKSAQKQQNQLKKIKTFTKS